MIGREGRCQQQLATWRVSLPQVVQGRLAQKLFHSWYRWEKGI